MLSDDEGIASSDHNPSLLTPSSLSNGFANNFDIECDDNAKRHQLTVRFLSNNSRYSGMKLAALAESEESIISGSSHHRYAQSSGVNEHVCMIKCRRVENLHV